MAHLAARVTGRPKLAAALADVEIDRDALARLPSSAFAWPEERAFPVHDAKHALLSRVYREGVAGVPAHVDRALKEACDIYGVDDALLARPKIAAAVEPEDAFLLPQHRRLRVTEAGHVKAAEARLLAEGKSLSVASRALAAGRLVEKAAALGVPVRPETQRQAGNVVTDSRKMASWIDARAGAALQDHAAGYEKLAAMARALPAELRDRDAQARIACALEELDELSGLSRYWGRRLPDPMATVFNTTKVAGAGVTLAGRFVPIERVAAHDAGFYSDVLGPDIVREAADASGQLDPARLAAVLSTLPVDLQRVLAAQMG